MDWLKTWALARYGLGLSEVEFWNMTPVQLRALLHEKNYERAVRLADLSNLFCRRKGQKPYVPDDFLPSSTGPDAMVDELKSFFE